AAIHTIRNRVGERLAPLVDDTYFDVMMAADETGRRDDANASNGNTVKGSRTLLPRGGMSRQVAELRSALEIAAQAHLITSLLNEGALARETAELVPIRDRFRAASHTLGKAIAALADDQLKTRVAELLRYGQGETD